MQLIKRRFKLSWLVGVLILTLINVVLMGWNLNWGYYGIEIVLYGLVWVIAASPGPPSNSPF